MDASRKTIHIVALATVFCAANVIAATATGVRLAASLPLVFYFPGYALLQAAFPQKRGRFSDAVFAVGLSIVVSIFCGFCLHLIGAMTRGGWATALCAATLAGCIVARQRARPPSIAVCGSKAPRLLPAQVIMLLGGGTLALGAFLLARHEALARREFAYTEFWMVPDGGGLVAVGIKNAEAKPSRYDVEISVNGSLVRVWRRIPLDVGESWTADLAMPSESTGVKGAQAWLFKDGDHGRVYRRVWLPAPMED
jgi:uncharacterized membrane protein